MDPLLLLLLSLSILPSFSRFCRTQIKVWKILTITLTGPSLCQPMHLGCIANKFKDVVNNIYLVSVIDLQRQLILTKDNITVDIDTVVYYRIIDPTKAKYRIQNINASVSEITYATLRTVCGQHTLQQLLEKRQQVADIIQNYVEDKVKDWGIYVQQIYIKDMILSKQLQTDLSMTAKTRRLAQSKIISAQADVQSAKLMRQAADILDSKAAMQIRYLQILGMMAKGSGQKILFLPLSTSQFSEAK